MDSKITSTTLQRTKRRESGISGLSPSRSMAKSVSKYSKIIATLRIVLPSLALFLIALVVLLPQFRGEDERFIVDIGPSEESDSDSLSLVNARYFGTDEQGQPFSLTAKVVQELQGSETDVRLTSPKADISLNNGTWLVVGASDGIYDRSIDVLNLTGEVSLFQDQGFEIHTSTAEVDLKEGSAEGEEPVHGQGTFGQLESHGFRLEDKGKKILFKGPARLILNSRDVTTSNNVSENNN